ncbi:M48 family metalloprotease [Micromonospora sp. WMMD1274]|uniref:M48 family metalloprotease n=1 Tax=Micromonospora sp. WMMD1274 TaxID=3404116 RepID=UPI003B94382E
MTGPRLNPFALPPATTGRFLLLMATAVAASVQVYGWLVARLETVSAAPARCVGTARGMSGTVRPDQLIDWYAECEVWASVREARLVALMIAVFAVVTVAIYFAMPRYTRRGLVPLRRYADDPVLGPTVRRIEELVASERKGVDLYVAPASGRGMDRAFGRIGRYAIVLNISRLAVAAARPDDPALAAVLRHEIAHLRNRDIDLTYLTIAVRWGFLGAVVVLPLAYVAWQAPEALWGLSWRLAVLLVLFWLLNASVLRARELYADASTDDSDGLIRTLTASPGPHEGTRPAGWFAFHPYVRSRLAVIRDTDRLFTLEPGVAAAVGALVGLGYPPAEYLAALLLPDHTYLPGWICGLTFGSFVAAVLAGAAWRAALWAAAAPGRTVRTFPSALSFTAALMGGLLLTPDLPQTGSFWRVAEAEPLIAVTIGVLLLGLAYVYLRWTVFCAASHLPVAGRPRSAYRFGVTQSALVLGVWLAAWFQIGGLLLGTGVTWVGLAVVLVAALFNPLLMISLPWACWYPLVTWRGRRGMAGGRFRLWQEARSDVALRGLRTPLGAALLTAVCIPAAYAIVMIPLRPALRSMLEKRMDDLTPTPSEHLGIAALLAWPAVAVTCAGLLLLGAIVGGRQRLERAVTAAGAAVLPASAALVLLMLLHVSLATPDAKGFFEMLTGLTMAGGPATDRPENAALGLMVVLLFGLLLLAGLPATVVGSMVRTVRPAPVPRRPPGRPGRVTAVLVTPILLLGTATAVMGGREWRVPETAVVPDSIEIGQVEQVLAEPWPIDAPLDQACGHLLRPVGEVRWSTTATSSGFDILLARAAAGARTAADPALRMMGESSVEALRRGQLLRAQRGVTAAIRYCAALA